MHNTTRSGPVGLAAMLLVSGAMIAGCGGQGEDAAPGPAETASSTTSDWTSTFLVQLGTCTSTKKLADGLYMQVCSRLLDSSSNGGLSATAQSYAVFTNTGTSSHWIHVAQSTQRIIATEAATNTVQDHTYATTPACGTIQMPGAAPGGKAISWTCPSKPAHWEVFDGGWGYWSGLTYGVFRLEYDGKVDGVRSTPTLSF